MPFRVLGKILLCNQGTKKYSKAKVLDSLDVVVLDGVGKGKVMSLTDWDNLVENTAGSVCDGINVCNNCTSFNNGLCERKPYQIDIEETGIRTISHPDPKLKKKESFFFRHLFGLITCYMLED